ncbi:MAG: adenylate/guanylate cyclase domain-containing protein [Spirochaetia bacterium]|nr:adenylate/guanylate cyclase domain-containing protein [Spirochaetia bacterium]
MVDPAVRDHILSGEVKLGGETRDASILFTDIRNFTGLSEHRDPEEIVEWLNRFFTEVGQAVAAERGFINKFIGDAVMAVFGAPLAIPDHADRALRAALGIRRGIARLNEEFLQKNLPPLRIGIGIHTGRVLAGNIGSASRMEYTAIGDAVNLASRVEGLCRNLNVDLLLTGETASRLSPGFQLQTLPDSVVKGKEKPVTLFTIAAA